MSVAYADASVLASLAFREPEAARVRRRLTGFDAVVTSVLTEAELAGRQAIGATARFAAPRAAANQDVY